MAVEDTPEGKAMSPFDVATKKKKRVKIMVVTCINNGKKYGWTQELYDEST